MPLGLAALLTACQSPSPEEQAAADARAVARVEAAQEMKPPVQPVMPEPVPLTARKVFKLSEAGCDFRSDPQPGAEPLLIAGRAKAVLRINGQPAILAADSGSPELPFGARVKYSGRQHWAQLTREPATGEGTLILRDRYDRVVYAATGPLDCAENFAR